MEQQIMSLSDIEIRISRLQAEVAALVRILVDNVQSREKELEALRMPKKAGE